jgi:hypothetical protein
MSGVLNLEPKTMLRKRYRIQAEPSRAPALGAHRRRFQRCYSFRPALIVLNNLGNLLFAQSRRRRGRGYGRLNCNPDVRSSLSYYIVSPRHPGDLCSLQAADLFAYEPSHEFENRVKRPKDDMRWGLRQIVSISEHVPDTKSPNCILCSEGT